MPDADSHASTVHSLRSSYREMILEHLFIGELLRAMWNRGIQHAEVLKAAVDDSGYDLVLDCGGSLRYIQLKSRTAAGKARTVTVNLDLLAKPGAAVIWMLFDDALRFTQFLLFEPSDKSGTVALKVAKHTKGNTSGTKTERPRHREVPIAKFERGRTGNEAISPGWATLTPPGPDRIASSSRPSNVCTP